MNKIALRILTATLALLMLTLCMTACGGGAEGFAFKANGTEIRIGAYADDVIPKLGTPVSTSETASCGGIPGNDYVYTFAGYRVKTTPAEGGNVICQIELTDDSLKTPEGLYIGMPSADVQKCMGDMDYDDHAMGLSYTKGNTQLRISFSTAEGGTVTSISYLEVQS